jgi:hypothetical protein
MVRTDQLVFVGFVVTLSSLLTGKSAFEIDTPDDGSSCAQQLSGGKFPAKILANSTTASRSIFETIIII